MNTRLSLVALTLVIGLGLGVSQARDRADAAAALLGTQVSDFALRDTQGQTVALAGLKDRKAIVVIFLGTECPINNAFLPHLAKLHARYAPHGVQFLGVNANLQDTAAQVAEHARRYEIPFPVLKDDQQTVANLLDARRTPEAVVLDANRVVRYRGRIDDQFGLTYRRPGKPTRHDLAEALDEVLAGKPVSVPTTEVAGCLIHRPTAATAGGGVTFTREVARILQNNCQECHRKGQIGPMSLVSYEDTTAWSDMIREVLQDGRMPPWHADPRYGKFANDRRLPAADKETLLAWIAQGCPRGDPKDLPPPRTWNDTWAIGKPDVIFTMEEEYAVPAETPKRGIPYQYFYIKTNFTEDRWIERAQARPGNNEVVHHIVVFIVPPGLKFIPKLGNAPVLCGTAPGDMPLILKPGLAKKVPAGSQLVMQMHYTPNGRAQKDRSSIGIVFAKEPPQRRVHTFPIAVPPPLLRIPAHADNHKVESSYTFQADGYALSFMPHMHLRGKDFLIEAITPDGKKETILSVPRFDFNWQSVYRLAEPLRVTKGTVIHCVAHFDNSAKNPNNPDPSQPVYWGDQTWEEMMIGWMDYIYDRKAE